MEKQEIIKNIAARSGGDIYLGVVGAVRTGKSTFIKRMVETLVVPNIEDEYERKRCLDELPQAAAGKTIMTTEPKFVPATATKIQIDDYGDKAIILPNGLQWQSRDSVYVVPTIKWKGCWFWKRAVGVQLHMFNSNPHTKIVGAQYIELKKPKKAHKLTE